MKTTYNFEELDSESKAYLIAARDRKGVGMPGILIPRLDVLPWFSLIAGLAIIAITIILTFPPTKGPIPMALGQTAGFLLGGWLVVAAFRTWIAHRGTRSAGHFLYADPEFLYQCKGSKVEVTDLINLHSVRATHNYNNDKFVNSTVEMAIQQETFQVTVPNEELANQLTSFLHAVTILRDGGANGTNQTLKNLPIPIIASMALTYSRTGQFPDRITQENLEITYIPKPKVENRPSFGWLGLFGTVLAGVLLFVFFYNTNPVVKQETQWDELKNQPMEFQVPMLRAYLADEQNLSHREEAKERLNQFYTRVSNERVNGSDPQYAVAMKTLVMDLASRQPVISIAVRDQSPNPDETKRKHLADYLADRLGSTIGDTLVNFVLIEKDADFKAQLELEYHVVNANLIEFNLEIRRDRTEAPILTVTKVPFPVPPDTGPPNFPLGLPASTNAPYPQDGAGLFIIPNSAQTKLAESLVNKLVGPVRPRPLPPRDDF